MKSHLKLFICQPSQSRKQFEVGEDQIFVVGRGSQSHTRLTDPEMSRRHFALKCGDGQIQLTDLSSASGTYCNGQRVSGIVKANVGDEIVAGKTRVFLVSANGNGTTDLDTKDIILEELGGLVGTWLSNFFIRKIIGIGKTGLVFLAFDEAKNRTVALKIYSRKYTDDDERRKQFVNGINALKKVQHPNLIRILQAGKNNHDYYYVAMQLVRGESLDQAIKNIGIDYMLDWKEAWNCCYQIGTVLAVIYENNVVHRNVLPRNIIRREKDGDYLLGDNSRACKIDPAQISGWKGREFISDLQYLPPERIQDETGRIQDSMGNYPISGTTDIRSDIFGLGACCYAMLTGKPPSEGVGLSELFEDIRSGEPALPQLAHLAVNEQFQAIVMRMISKNANNRYQTPKELLKELGQVGRLSGLDF